MANLKRMSLKVSEDLYDFISQEAANRGLTMNAVVIFALENYRKENTVLPNLKNMQTLLEAIQQQQSVPSDRE